MVDPLSVSIGVGVAAVIILAAAGLYLAGRYPDHIVNMREVGSYLRRQQAIESLQRDVEAGDDQE